MYDEKRFDPFHDPFSSEPEHETESKLSGIHFEISNEDYHAHESISKSGFDLIDISPAHYMKGKRKETKAFIKGTLIHCAILEPDFIHDRYFEMPEKPDLRTNKGKALLAEYTAISGGKILVTADEMVMATRVRDEVHRHTVTRQLFNGGYSEASVFSSLNGVDVRCRPDYRNGAVTVDLKSTESATPNSFKISVEKYRYYVQHPFYVDVMAQEGIDTSAFVFVAIEKSEPYGIGVFMLDDNAIEFGRKSYLANLDTYKRCLDSGVWPCYPDIIKTISLSKYSCDAIDRHIDESQ